jgi:Zn-dependent M28 family amino/carboxypeptidase
MLRGRYLVDSAGAGALPTGAPVLWARRGVLERLRAPGRRLALELRAESYVYPSANVVAVAPGRDPALASEYVLFSGHHDHDGVRAPVAGDSVWNGADDNATVSVALLAIGRAWTRAPGRRRRSSSGTARRSAGSSARAGTRPTRRCRADRSPPCSTPT